MSEQQTNTSVEPGNIQPQEPVPLTVSPLVPSYPACDRCHTRKVRCDRQVQCQHCAESASLCQRTRSVVAGKRQRRPKSKPPLEVSKLEDRLARLEKSITTQSNSPNYHSENSSQQIPSDLGSTTDQRPAKRSRSTAHTTPIRVHGVLSPSTTLNTDASEPSNLFSSTGAEAQSTIQQALGNAACLSESGRRTLTSALSTIREMLRGHEHAPTDRQTQEILIESSTLDVNVLPPPEFLQEILQHEECTTELFQWFVFLSQKSFIAMYSELFQQPPEKRDVRKLICVCNVFGWFVSDRVIHGRRIPGLEACLEQRVRDYFEAVTVGAKQLSLLSPPNLLSIQALLCGAFRLQEIGDQSGCWTLTAAASHMCAALGLNSRIYADTPEDDEMRWCFLCCYALDQGMAMNLARSPTFHDSNIDPAIFRPRQYEFKNIQFELHYLTMEFARIQSSIHTDLRSFSSRKDSPSVRHQRLQAIKRRMDDLYKTIAQLKSNTDIVRKVHLSSQVVIIDFSYYNLVTILYRSEPILPEEPFLKDECLQAARSTLRLIQPLRDEVSAWQSHVAIAHWSLLYYPFTPFFVLFCNVLFNSHFDDLRLMKDMTEYLGKVRDSSPIAMKLYALCATFCDLATTISNIEICKKQQMLRQESTSRYANNAYAKDPHNMDHTSMGQTPYANQQMLPMPYMQEQGVNGLENMDLMTETQDQADILWQLLLSDPTAQWLETDFSGIMPMTE